MNDTTEITFSHEADSWLRQNYRYSRWDAEEFAAEQDWTGFGFVVYSDDSPLSVPGDYVSGHQCEHALEASNADQAMRLIREAAGRDACEEFAGCVAYDHGNDAARQAAEKVSAQLADYPVLNEEDYGEREHDNAAEVLRECYDITDEDLIGEVISAICDRGESLCTDCSSWDIDEIMSDLGYRQCTDCNEWLETGHDEPLCYDCADSYAEADCECVSVMVTGYKHGGHVVTMADVKATLRGCEDCYPKLYPYGH